MYDDDPDPPMVHAAGGFSHLRAEIIFEPILLTIDEMSAAFPSTFSAPRSNRRNH
jgi:hypothetical protein